MKTMKTKQNVDEPLPASDLFGDSCANCIRWQSFDRKTGECHDTSNIVWMAGHDMKLVDAPETPNDGWCQNWSASPNASDQATASKKISK